MTTSVLSRSTLAALTAVVILAGQAPAQETDETEGEDCVCVRAPRVSVWTPRGAFDFLDRRGRLGISVSGDQDDGEYPGARVMRVVPGGPADEAGLREGDVITALGGHSLFEPLEDREAEREIDVDASVPVQRLLAIARELEPESRVEVRFERDGEERTTELEVGDFSPRVWLGRRGSDPFHVGPDDMSWRELDDLRDFERHLDAEALRGRIERQIRPSIERIRAWTPGFRTGGLGWNGGLTLAPMNSSLGEYFEAQSGALVLEVHEDSQLGLRAGDVILSIDGRDVEDDEHAHRILGSYRDDETVRITVIRRGSEMVVEGVVARREWK